MKLDVTELKVLTESIEIELESLIRPIEEALLIAYLRDKGELTETPQPGTFIRRMVGDAPVRVKLDVDNGEVQVLVTELNEAGEPVGEFDDTPADFARIAAATTRKILGDRLRTLTGAAKAIEYENLVGTMVSGTIQQGSDPKMVFVDLGRIEAVMPPAEQVPTEKYQHGERLKVLVAAVRQLNNGTVVTVSRTHPGLVKALFALEVPEVSDGTVEIVALAREAGNRTKMAVRSHKSQVAAKGSCIGPMGSRVNAVVNELNGEKIDIVDFSEDPQKFIAAALAPSRVVRVDILDDVNKVARVFVPDYQLSLAIGKEGQNARLAARLTTWKIDIRSDADPMFSQSSISGVEAG
jgi:N utilization substance protein A